MKLPEFSAVHDSKQKSGVYSERSTQARSHRAFQSLKEKVTGKSYFIAVELASALSEGNVPADCMKKLLSRSRNVTVIKELFPGRSVYSIHKSCNCAKG